MDPVKFLSILTLISNIVFVILVFLFLSSKLLKGTKPAWKKAEKVLVKKSLLFALIVSSVATLGSLYFSEVRGFEPCKLCWIQRIFMYPLPIILGIAIWKKLEKVYFYVLPLAVIGAVIAAYHYYYQMTGSALIPCSTLGFSVSCSERFFTYWGYITIPWMSLSAFAYIAALAALKLKSETKKVGK